LIYKRFICS